VCGEPANILLGAPIEPLYNQPHPGVHYPLDPQAEAYLMTCLQLNAQPGPIALDPASTAVLVVDMQNDFGANGGLFDHAGIDISMIQAVVRPITNVIASARRASIPIVYLKMGFQPDLSDLGSSDSPNRVRHLFFGVGKPTHAPDGSESRFLIRDTWNTGILADLKPEAGDVILYKHRFSGFYETELDAVLKDRGIRNLIVAGCTTSVCVESTVRDAMFRDYSCVVLSDCTAEPIGFNLPRTNHEASLLAIQTLFGWVSTSNDFLAALGAQPLAAAQSQS
jgi:ureidoacrylate peracid hydrolase